jgi:proline dehydrogenase
MRFLAHQGSAAPSLAAGVEVHMMQRLPSISEVDLGINVRVVKGQWVDPEEPGMDPRAGFLAIIDRLAVRSSHVAVATHDLPLAQEALQRLRAANTSCELQLIFGLPTRQLVQQACAAGVPVRF